MDSEIKVIEADTDDFIGSESPAKIKDFSTNLRQYNSKQWYENLEGSDVVF